MAQALTSLFATNFNLTGTHTLTVVDTATTGTVQTMPTGWYRCYLANSGSSDGSAGAPYELFQKVREKLGAYWFVDINGEGKVAISYRGSTAGSITFGSSTLQKLLGFSTGSLAFASSGSVVTSSYQPYGTLFTINRANDTGYQRSPSFNAYQELPNGEVYGYSDSFIKHTRKQDLRFHPTNQTYKEALGALGTPFYPTSQSQWAQPPLVGNGYEPPYTISHFLYEAAGKPVACALGNLQGHLSGSETVFDTVYVRPSTLQATEVSIPSSKGFSKYRDLPGFQVILSGSGARLIYSASALSSSFAPSDISNLYAWFKYDNLLLNGTTVSAALDKSGNGRHAVQATSASQPVYSATGGANNKAYWSNTDAVSNGRFLLAGQASDWTFLHNGSGNTIFIVMKSNSTQQNYFFGIQTGTGASLGLSIVRINNTTAQYSIGNGAIQSVTVNYSHPLTSWSKVAVSGSTGTDPDYSIRVAGSSVATANEVNPVSATASTQKLGIGSGGGGAYSLASDFHEVIIYNRELTLTEVGQVETYLSGVYGI